ncbi:MAG: hypothetical protein GY772_24170, partial [bacterium]|nr:hypothetical protein [bacterium]
MRLTKIKARTSEQANAEGERDWTNLAPDADQESASRAYPLGFAVAHVEMEKLKKYGHEGG